MIAQKKQKTTFVLELDDKELELFQAGLFSILAVENAHTEAVHKHLKVRELELFNKIQEALER